MNYLANKALLASQNIEKLLKNSHIDLYLSTDELKIFPLLHKHSL